MNNQPAIVRRISEHSVEMIRRELVKLGKEEYLQQVLDWQHENGIPVSAICLALMQLDPSQFDIEQIKLLK